MKQFFSLVWAATFFLTIATIVRAFDYSNTLDLIMTLAGCSLWSIEGYRMKSPPLMFINVFSVAIVVFGLLTF